MTVHDPARPDASPDLLDSGPEPAPLLTRRRVVASLTAAAVLAGVSGLVELRERRQAAAEERRLAAEVSLSLPAEGSSGGATYDGSGGELQVDLLVRNDGPRDVELVGARTSGFSLVTDVVRLPAGQVRQLDLRQQFTCQGGRPAPLQPGPVQVDVRTGGGATSTVELPLQQPPFGLDEPARMCGWVPVQEAVHVGVLEGRQDADLLRLDLDLSNASRFPLQVVRLLTGPGLSARLLAGGGGGEVPLPQTLASAQGAGWSSTAYEVELRVVDCALARQQDVGTVGVQVRDREGATAESLADYEPRLLSGLLSASCP